MSQRSARTVAAKATPYALLAPSLIATAIFVYGFALYSIWVSFTDSTVLVDMSLAAQPLDAYAHVAQDFRFQSGIRNIVIFTVLFLGFSTAIGLISAILINQTLRGKSIFRMVLLLPYTISFVVTGVIWRWLFTPSTGVNTLLGALGLPSDMSWINDKTIIGNLTPIVNWFLPGDPVVAQLGVPVALIPIAIAASWQLAGFTMAVFLAALAGIPKELQEAASLDGAGLARYYGSVALPALRPALVTVLVLLGFTSLKSFDLFVAIAGSSPGFVTDVPAVYIFDHLFRRNYISVGAAAATVFLILTLVVTVPYLIRTQRKH